MRSPIRWIGGKGMIVAKLLPLLPSHHTYVEPFGGGASLLFAKEPSKVEIYNDIDGRLVNLFRVLRDKRKFKEFYRMVSLTPYARADFDLCLATANFGTDVERAYKFYVLSGMSFGGNCGDFGMDTTRSNRGMSGMTSKWLSGIELLPEICTRLTMVQIDNRDWREVLCKFDTKNTLFYIDPPYLMAEDQYRYNLNVEDHVELVDILLGLQGMAMLSGYKNNVYEQLESSGWRTEEWETKCFYSKPIDGNRVTRTECVWISPNCEIASGPLF